MTKKIAMFTLCLLVIAPLLLTACGPTTPAQRGAVTGAAAGAIGGQIIGGNTKSTLIGAGAGALGGALINDAVNKPRY